MRLILAILLPFVVFFTIGKPFQGILCLILQITLIGWIPAAIWAVYALSQYNTDKKIAAFPVPNARFFSENQNQGLAGKGAIAISRQPVIIRALIPDSSVGRAADC